jgi:serine/threonine protein kinase
MNLTYLSREIGSAHYRFQRQLQQSIDRPTFLKLIREQLSTDLDTDCDPVGIHGARGALFKVTLTSHGYTVAAKCTVIDFVSDLKHEAAVYTHLHPIQGIHIPVYLGNVDLQEPYDYDGIAKLVHMMFLSFGGRPIHRLINAGNRSSLIQRADRSIRALHQLGVCHRDAMPRNMLWNEEAKEVMMIDFERSQIIKQRTVLGVISPNRKRKRVARKDLPKISGLDADMFTREVQQATTKLRQVFKS